MEEEFPEVTFITVCKTTNDVAWKKTMEKHHAHGIQLREDRKLTKLTEILQVSACPRFMVYSPDGKLINKNAPRYTHSQQIRSLLRKYLKK